MRASLPDISEDELELEAPEVEPPRPEPEAGRHYDRA